jgi:hypothetical protein
MASFKVLSKHLPGETVQKHRKFQAVQPVSEVRFELRTSQIQSRSTDHSTVGFGYTKFSSILFIAREFCILQNISISSKIKCKISIFFQLAHMKYSFSLCLKFC